MHVSHTANIAHTFKKCSAAHSKRSPWPRSNDNGQPGLASPRALNEPAPSAGQPKRAAHRYTAVSATICGRDHDVDDLPSWLSVLNCNADGHSFRLLRCGEAAPMPQHLTVRVEVKHHLLEESGGMRN